MSQRRKKREQPLSKQPVPTFIAGKVQTPAAVVLGSPAEVCNLVAACPGLEPVCYQMDHFQGGRLRDMLTERGLKAVVEVKPDLWDLPGGYRSAVYLPARRGERELKIDMVEQSWHILADKGTFLVWSPYEGDPFFPNQLKKVYGRVHTPPHGTQDVSSVLWCQREGERPKRRHEVTFQVRIADGQPCRFVSRPGTFSYGRFDDGARALCEVMEIEPGDRVLDLGCGVGTNGTFAWQKAGAGGHIAFVDSNARAAALTEMNARANGVTSLDVFATATVEGPAEDSFDVAIANPPYFANSTIAKLFVERSRKLLTPQGRFFLVTKVPEDMAGMVMETFGEDVIAFENRGYTILKA
jgi:16S rRNA (guanine1207-N2)-methyltransferase